MYRRNHKSTRLVRLVSVRSPLKMGKCPDGKAFSVSVQPENIENRARHGIGEVYSEKASKTEVNNQQDSEARMAACQAAFYRKAFNKILLRRVWEEWSTSSAGKNLLRDAGTELSAAYMRSGLGACLPFVDEVRTILKVKVTEENDKESESEKSPRQALKRFDEKKVLIKEVCERVLGLCWEGLFSLQTASPSANVSLHDRLTLEELELVRDCPMSFGGDKYGREWTLQWLPKLTSDLESLIIQD